MHSTTHCAGSELLALGFHQKSSHAYMKKLVTEGVKKALTERDKPFGDDRTKETS